MFIKKKINLLSLFSGIGAFEKALTNIGVDYNLVASSEWDIYPAVAYNAIHHDNDDKFKFPSKKDMINHLLKLNLSKEGKKPCDKDYIKRLKGNKLKGIYKAFEQSNNLGSVKNINPDQLPENIDLITHGSPCQDFSVRGKNQGGNKNSGTRSSLMWYTVDIVKKVKPKYIIWEQVPNVLSKKHKHNFDKYLDSLKQAGYCNYYKKLNSNNFNIPQKRKRIFVVSINKNEKINFNFDFEQNYKKETLLNELIEDKVKEKYIISYSRAKNTIQDLTAEKIGINPCIQPSKTNTHQNGRRFKEDNEEMFTLLSGGRHGILKSKTKDFNKENYGQDKDWVIRRLTPLEYFRLMGFDDKDYFKAKQTMEKVFYNGNDRSDSRMYKMAGNSIVVPVLEEIFTNLFIKTNYLGCDKDEKN